MPLRPYSTTPVTTAKRTAQASGAKVARPCYFICVLPAPDRVRAAAAPDRVKASRKASPAGVAFTSARTAPYGLADLQIERS